MGRATRTMFRSPFGILEEPLMMWTILAIDKEPDENIRHYTDKTGGRNNTVFARIQELIDMDLVTYERGEFNSKFLRLTADGERLAKTLKRLLRQYRGIVNARGEGGDEAQ